MPSLKDLKVRIKSVKSTQKITKAMKMVAASKLRRAREAAEASRPYALAMESMVERLAAGYRSQPENAPKLLVGTGSDKKHLLIVTTADRGLCGAFNGSIVRAARRRVAELEAQGKTVRLYTIGRKGRDLLGQDFRKQIAGGRTDVAKKTVAYATADEIAADIFDIMAREGIDVVSIVYNHFKSAIQQVVTFRQLVPLAARAGATEGVQEAYDYEPEESEILADLLPRNIAMQVFKALLESAASEQGARMNAMESATKNAGEMIKKLSLRYNRTRQANITKELIEIISGAEAL
ncbi:MAG: F0F1 ATP synthase subunit gamma [Alphaproteobacteria bacterium]